MTANSTGAEQFFKCRLTERTCNRSSRLVRKELGSGSTSVPRVIRSSLFGQFHRSQPAKFQRLIYSTIQPQPMLCSKMSWHTRRPQSKSSPMKIRSRLVMSKKLFKTHWDLNNFPSRLIELCTVFWLGCFVGGTDRSSDLCCWLLGSVPIICSSRLRHKKILTLILY
jgi:hypothetical protein